MTRIEVIMLCLAYALGRIPRLSEIRRARHELDNVNPRSVNMVIKSANFLYPYMTKSEISLFKKQVCTCMLCAINYRISLTVMEYNSRGYAICPRCGESIDRDFQPFCARCGQHLQWVSRKRQKRVVQR